MSQFQSSKELTAFKSPEQEIDYLRREVARRDEALLARGERIEPVTVAKEAVADYAIESPERLLTPKARMTAHEEGAIVLKLSPETHDRQMEELLGILQEKGVLSALKVVEKIGNPHLTDDFHRFVAEYIREGYPVAIKEKESLWRPLHMTLFEIALPEYEADGQAKDRVLAEILSSMEQFYAGMLSVAEDGGVGAKNYFSLEIANPCGSSQFIIYAAVPTEKGDLFEKQLLSFFPKAVISEKRDDYNIFNHDGKTASAQMTLARNPIYAIKTYDEFNHDPVNALINAFSKVNKDGEGAAVQFLIAPAPDTHLRRYKKALLDISKGVPLKEATDIRDSFFSDVTKAFSDFVTTSPKKDKEVPREPSAADQAAIENITTKVSSPMLKVSVRIVASAGSLERAKDIVSHLSAAFNQFEDTHGNKVKFEEVSGGKHKELLSAFSFRTFKADIALPINIKELVTLFHFPEAKTTASPQLKGARAALAAAPVDLPKDGIVLGVNRFRSVDTTVHFSPEDRLRHFYTIGQTGTGKTTLLKHMIVQDIERGEGVCLIDPHGSDVLDVLSAVPSSRANDVIYFDPGVTDRPMGLNMLEYDQRFPEQKTFVVNELLSIFNKLFDMKIAGGPMFEQYFRNAVLLVMEDPETGNTLIDVSRVLSDRNFRAMKLSRSKNPIVVEFWKNIAEKAGGESSLANMVPYITNKFDVFLSNDIMRPIIGQERSSFKFRDVMDSKKILLVNLAKGRLGDINSHLIGLILVGKILMAALSRVDAATSDKGVSLPPFYLFIDEFQNITTDSIATILSEARKYKLSLTIAHQFIAQLDEKIKDAVFGNVGSIASFRVGAEDAEYLEKQFSPVFSAKDLMNIVNRNAYLKLLINGKPARPFNIETLPPPSGNRSVADRIRELSLMTFGRPRADVEAEIMSRYQRPVS